jgi:hypothetical protein
MTERETNSEQRSGALVNSTNKTYFNVISAANKLIHNGTEPTLKERASVRLA